MLIAALTGNIAAGKSTVAAGLAARGATVIDSDLAARAAVAPGTPALTAIVQAFGKGVLQADGSLDRALLGARVFSDPHARATLERIVHPAVEEQRMAAIAAARRDAQRIVVCDIPLLFEARLAYQFERIVLVDASVDTRIRRLVDGRQLSRAQARARIAAQLPATLKRGRADLVLDNNDDLASLQRDIEAAWQRVQHWAAVAESPSAA
jgi:dephospho-CoA kinase